ncbi:hypothetical protein IGI04_042411 [Brassica rapa subsp. trilocularis]|uniref:Uncharacterized protein n=1 Tax=Brassica rapa subsp. trilocularis TaxID=1813537 RepID=A0ABQ7KK19_BRACM|nr:hypothetical protein IGI04_042411 [Brassica rapa subsp. trilocularis]
MVRARCGEDTHIKSEMVSRKEEARCDLQLPYGRGMKPERWKGGTSCKRGRLRKLSKEWLMKRRAWRKDSESEHLSDRMSVILKRIKDVLQQMVIGECSYSAYMGETVGDSADMRGMDTKRADECVTKKEWDELVKHVTGPSNQAGEAGGTTPLDHERGNGSESGEQEHNQEDSGQHDQEETHEVESGAQSGGNEQGEPTGNEQGEPTGLREEAQENAVTLEIYHSNFIVTVVTEVKDLGSYLASIWRVKHARRSLDKQGGVWIRSDVDIKETINKEVKTKERWAEWSWIVTGPNGWEDFESLTRPVTCTLNGSPLPLGDSKHSSCLLLFYISHSYALHSKLGLSCTDRLVLQGTHHSIEETTNLWLNPHKHSLSTQPSVLDSTLVI